MGSASYNPTFSSFPGHISDKEMAADYCHFNTSHSAHHFTLSLFNHDVHFIQHPGRTDLGHGVVVWDAGVIFAKYLEHQSFEACKKAYKDLSVLELGSGCGIGGLALMLCGAKVTFTDLPAILEQITRPNILVSVCIYRA